MKILAIIPARSGSKGVPNKNIKILNDKPLIAYSIETALKCGFDNIIVSTNDIEISNIAKSYGANVPFLRPENLAMDSTPTIDVIVDLISKLSQNGENYDAICLLQPTVPFREISFVKNAIEKFKIFGYDTLLSVKLVPHQFNPNWVFFENNGYLEISTGEKKIISRRQDLKTSYYRDGSIYLTDIKTINEKKSFYGERIGFIINENEKHVNIDTMEDWKLAEFFLK